MRNRGVENTVLLEEESVHKIVIKGVQLGIRH